MLSPCNEPRKRFTHKEKGKKKMSKYATGSEESDRSDSNSGKNKGGPSDLKFEPATRVHKSANAVG